MKIKILLLLIYINKIESKISLNISTSSSNLYLYSGNYRGEEIVPVTDEDMASFFANPGLYEAVKMYHERRPTNVYYKKPTPWGDLYSSYGWEPVMKKISVQYIHLRNSYNESTVVLTHDFDNPSNHTIRVNTGLSHRIHNRVSSWWNSSSTTELSGFGIDVKFVFIKASGNSGFSTTTSWGRNEFRSESITVGTTHGVGTELRPGQSVTAELSVTTRYVEFEVGYKMYLQGKLAVNYYPTHRGHHFYGLLIERIVKAANIPNVKLLKQRIRVAYNIDARTKVTDKVTGLLLLF